jgi:hypothetical protein
MAKVDMSAEAVTARLKLVSELKDLCLLLGTAKIESPSEKKKKQEHHRPRNNRKPSK